MAERTAGIDRARDAVGRGSWADAYTAFGGLDPAGMTPRDLESFADAAWWLSKNDESIAVRQRAFAGYAAAGEAPEAAGVAVRLVFDHADRGEASVAMGWMMQAQRLLQDQEESIAHGFLAMCRAVMTVQGGDPEAARLLAEEAMRIGQRFADRDLVVMAVHGQGRILIIGGRVDEGMALLDEAMASVVAGELKSAHLTGVIYCSVLEACLDLADVSRASEWSAAARAWCDSLLPEAPFTRLCRLNRVQVAILQGSWSEAESEARRVSEDATFDPMSAARAFYETGEIRRRIGNVGGAEEAFARARELGFDPQPGSALLRLAQGKVQAAATALRLALDGQPGGGPSRVRLLAPLVEVAIAAGDVATARTASYELDTIASGLHSRAVDAAAAAARGALHLAEDDVPAALEALRRACTMWQDLKLPYETARARMLYGVAVRRAGDEEDARLELQAALAAFERLGAGPDAARAAELLGERPDLPRGLSQREAEVLRLVAAGKSNREIASELVISEHTVARHLQNMFAKLDVSSRSAATAFAFEHGLA